LWPVSGIHHLRRSMAKKSKNRDLRDETFENQCTMCL
jgi:hypothetical protein